MGGGVLGSDLAPLASHGLNDVILRYKTALNDLAFSCSSA